VVIWGIPVCIAIFLALGTLSFSLHAGVESPPEINAEFEDLDF
jgi:hypothetical protein